MPQREFLLIISLNLFSLNPGGGGTDLSHYTHTRASGWLVGFLFGYFLHSIRGKSIKLNRPTVWVGWILSLALLLTCIFAMYPYGTGKSKTIPILNEAFYVSLSRIAWPLALSWVVFACMQGYGGLANSFLTSPLWQPSRSCPSASTWGICSSRTSMEDALASTPTFPTTIL